MSVATSERSSIVMTEPGIMHAKHAQFSLRRASRQAVRHEISKECYRLLPDVQDNDIISAYTQLKIGLLGTFLFSWILVASKALKVSSAKLIHFTELSNL